MSLASQLSVLASRIGNEIKGLIRPDHPGLARAWVNFGYANGSGQLRADHNVASVTRLAAGRYHVCAVLLSRGRFVAYRQANGDAFADGVHVRSAASRANDWWWRVGATQRRGLQSA